MADVQAASLVVDVVCLEPDDFCKAGAAVCEGDKQGIGCGVALILSQQGLQLGITLAQAIILAGPRTLDLDALEHVALLEVVLDDHVVHGSLDDPKGT